MSPASNTPRIPDSAVRTLDMPPREPVSMEHVRTLREAGLHELADIAERYVRRDELPWWRRIFS